MPNSLAYLVLLIWPMLAFGLFRWLPLERALIWSILGAYLVLPPVAAFDAPLVPPLDKFSISSLSAFLICVLLLGKSVPLLPASPVGRVLFGLFMASPVMTVLTNTDPIHFGAAFVPGLRMHDAISAGTNQAIAILPFLLARRFLATEAAQREILLALVVAGAAYSIPMLIEVRLSPQLNTWIYGFFQHDFTQMMRQGGFRPIVFLPHGLWAAFFALMAFLAALASWRAAPTRRRATYLALSGYLGVVLVLCKSAAVLVYAAALAPLVRFGSVRLQVRIAAGLAVVAILFPLLRGADLVPTGFMLEQAEAVSAERAGSLGYRFENEDALLARASERPFFGWGGWGRNHIYDPWSGEMVSVTDGRWIMVIGAGGWCGYIAEFGLLTLPLLTLGRLSRRRSGVALSPHAGPLALILGANLIDMLPNATLVPFTWLVAGAMLGYVEALADDLRRGPARAEGVAEAEPAEPARPRTLL